MFPNYSYNAPMYGNYPVQQNGSYEQPMFYQDRMSFLQNQIQQNRQPPINQVNGLYGKIVDSIEVVKATDIPMDGNMYYFPKADSSEIYLKRWLPNGTTEVITFSKSLPIVEEIVKEDVESKQEIFDKLNLIEKQISNIEEMLVQKPINKATRKEDSK